MDRTEGPPATDQAQGSGPPSRLARNLTIGALIVATAAAWFGDAVLTAQVDRYPVLFIALNARNRNLALAQGYLDIWTFFTVGTLRLLASDPLFFLLGRWYGDAAVRWTEARSPTYGPMLRGAERWFSKFSYPLVAIAPNNIICLFSGAAGMRPAVFMILNLGGTLVRMWLIWIFGDVFSGPLDWIRDLITDHRLAVTAVGLALLGFTLWNERRTGRTQLGHLAHIEEEMGTEAATDTGHETAADGSSPQPDEHRTTGDDVRPGTRQQNRR